MPKSPRTMKRRRFVTLVALSGAALVTAPLSRAAKAAARTVAPESSRRRAPTLAIRKEIANQEKSLAGQLKVVRDYPLPPGSPMAFVFKPLRARREPRS
jgi:hypothetical protein